MSTPINLRDAATYHKGLQHQINAWDQLQEQLSEEQLDQFATLYRAAPPPPPPVSTVNSAVILALPLVKYFEGFEACAYCDPLSGGEPYTIGYGTTVYPSGDKVRLGDKTSESQAEVYLTTDLNDCYGVQQKRIPTWARMSPQQQAAILSFAYNLGFHFYESSGFDTISRNLREANWDEVPDTLLMYCNPGTSVEAGLKRRRAAEGDLWSTGVWTA